MSKKEPDAVVSEVPKPSKDVALVLGATADGKGAHILRAREGRVELGAVQPVRGGSPIHGEVVKLSPRADAPRVCDVEVLVEKPSALASDVRAPVQSVGHKGPARVASDAYRENWDLIWKSKTQKSELLN